MNRRSLLAFIGFAPIATAAAALPRVADPVKLASTGGREVSLKGLSILDADTGTYTASGIFRCQTAVSLEGALSTISLSADKVYLPGMVDDVVDNLNAKMIWINAQSRECEGKIVKIGTFAK